MERMKIMMEEKEVQMVKQYPKYKPSGVDWIGEIPEHWEIKRLRYEIDFVKGKNPKELTFEELGKPYLTMEYLRETSKQVYYVTEYRHTPIIGVFCRHRRDLKNIPNLTLNT